MRSALRALATVGFCIAAVAALPAHAGEDRECGRGPTSRMIGRDAAVSAYQARGYRLASPEIAVDDGCYSARVRDAEGRLYKVKLNAFTGALVERRFLGDAPK